MKKETRTLTGFTAIVMLLVLGSCASSNEEALQQTIDDQAEKIAVYESILAGDPKDYASDKDIKKLTSTSATFGSRNVDKWLGKRIPMGKEEVDTLLNRYKRWRKQAKFPPSQTKPGKKVIPGATYSFGIERIKELLEDIRKSDKKDVITGIRIQLYEKDDPNSNKARMIDAFIVPVDSTGTPVPNGNFPKKQDLCPGCFTLNSSNPCPDNC